MELPDDFSSYFTCCSHLTKFDPKQRGTANKFDQDYMYVIYNAIILHEHSYGFSKELAIKNS